MGKPSIPPWMIPPKREQPAQIPLPVPMPQSPYDRRTGETDDEREPHSVDIDGDGDSGGYRWTFRL
jgi:hypothetical protein